MYAVLYVALFCWLGVMTGLLLISGFFGLLTAIVIGGVVIYGRRRSTQQDALLWALAIAAEREMPLAPTLDAFAGQSRGEYRRKVLAASHHLKQGRSISEVLDYEPGLFPRDVAVLIRVGGESGVLAGALREAAAARSTSRRPWVALAIRIAYLLWVMIVLQGVISFISYFILPKFEAIFADFGIPLPSITVVCIEITHIFIKYFFLTIPLFLLQLVLLMLASVSVLGVLPWDLPLIDRLFIRRHSATILRCIARVVEGNRPLAQGFATLARSYPAPWIRKRLEEVARDVESGDDWCEALARSRLIRPAEAVLLESARRVGNLPWALREAAETSERRLAYRYQVLAQWLLPLLLLAIAAVVFFVAVSYFSPLIMLTQRLT
jgi:protein transport protein HofC